MSNPFLEFTDDEEEDSVNVLQTSPRRPRLMGQRLPEGVARGPLTSVAFAPGDGFAILPASMGSFGTGPRLASYDYDDYISPPPPPRSAPERVTNTSGEHGAPASVENNTIGHTTSARVENDTMGRGASDLFTSPLSGTRSPAVQPDLGRKKKKTKAKRKRSLTQSPEAEQTLAKQYDTRRTGHDRKFRDLTRKDVAVWQSLQDFPNGKHVEKAYADAYKWDVHRKLPSKNERSTLVKSTLMKQGRTLGRMLDGIDAAPLIPAIMEGGPRGEVALLELNQLAFFKRTRWNEEPLTLADVQLWQHTQDEVGIRVIEESYTNLAGISVQSTLLDQRFQYIDRVFQRSGVDTARIAEILATVPGDNIPAQVAAMRDFNATLIGLGESVWVNAPTQQHTLHPSPITRPAEPQNRVLQAPVLPQQPPNQPQETPTLQQTANTNPPPTKTPQPHGGIQPTWAYLNSIMTYRDNEVQRAEQALAFLSRTRRFSSTQPPTTPAGSNIPYQVYIVRMRLNDVDQELHQGHVYISRAQANNAAMRLMGDVVAGNTRNGPEEFVANAERITREGGLEGELFGVTVHGLRVWVETMPLLWE